MTVEDFEIDEYIDELYENYVQEGLDFNTDQTLHDIFKQIFGDAVKLTIKDVENELCDDEDDGQPDEQKEWEDYDPAA